MSGIMNLPDEKKSFNFPTAKVKGKKAKQEAKKAAVARLLDKKKVKK